MLINGILNIYSESSIEMLYRVYAVGCSAIRASEEHHNDTDEKETDENQREVDKEFL